MSGDREALVSMLAGAGVWLDRCDEIADAIFASDWLAQVKADALADVEHKIRSAYFPDLDTAEGVRVAVAIAERAREAVSR